MFIKPNIGFYDYMLGKFLVTLSCIMFIFLHPLGQEIAYMKDTLSLKCYLVSWQILRKSF